MTDKQKVSDERPALADRLEAASNSGFESEDVCDDMALAARYLRAAPMPEVHSEVGDAASWIIREYGRGTPVDDLALVLFEAWCKAEPTSGPAQHPASYLATFADMARAAIGWQASQPLPAGVVDDAMVERAMMEADKLDFHLDDTDARSILTAALQNAGGEPVAWERTETIASTDSQQARFEIQGEIDAEGLKAATNKIRSICNRFAYAAAKPDVDEWLESGAYSVIRSYLDALSPAPTEERK